MVNSFCKIIQSLEKMGIKVNSKIENEPEGTKYNACRFVLNNHKIVFRSAKITQKKEGLFVTLWKRPGKDGDIEPLDIYDDFEFVIVEAQQKSNHGFFIFSKAVLVNHGVLASQGQGGKRALRIYPPWSKPASQQAIKSKLWQCEDFILLSGDGAMNPRTTANAHEKIRCLLSK